MLNVHFNKVFTFLYGTLLFLTPLAMYSRTSELFEFNKMLIIYLITGLVASVWVARMIFLRKIILRWHPLLFVFAAFLIVHILATITSIDVWTSFFGYYGRFNGGLLSLISYLILMLAFFSNIDLSSRKKTRATIHSLLKISLITSFVVLLWGLPSHFGYDLSCYTFSGNLDVACWTDQFKPTLRVFSTLGQPNWLGAYIVVHMFIAMYFFLTDKIFLRRVLYAGLMLFAMIMLLFTRSRSALFALIVGGVLFDAYLIKNKQEFFQKKYQKQLATLAGIIIIPVLLIGTGISQVDRFVHIPSLFSHQETQEQAQKIDRESDEISQEQGEVEVDITDSGEIRKIVWQGAFGLGLEHPLLGTGVETFAYSYNFVRPLQHNATTEWDYVYNKAHNELFNFIATTGFTGALIYLLMSVLVALYMRYAFNDALSQERQLLVVALVSAYVGLFVSNFLGFSTSTINIYYYLIPTLLIIIVHGKGMQTYKQDISITQDDVMKLVLPSIIAIVSVWFVIQYFRADTAYARGNVLRLSQEYGPSLEKYYDAYSIRPEHVYADKISQVLAQQGFIKALSGEQEINCSNIDRSIAPCITLAEYYSKKAIDASPYNALYYRTQARNNFLFFQTTQDETYIDRAFASVRKAQQLAPTDPRYPYLKALIALGLYESIDNPTDNDRNKLEVIGLGSIKLAIELKEDYIDGQYLKGLIQKNLGDTAGARETFEFILTLQPNNEQIQQELEEL